MGETSADIQKFKADIPKMAKLLDVRVSDLVRIIALNCVREIIPAHPVDTGYSRANWRLSADKPDMTVSSPPSAKGKAKKGKGWYPQRTPTESDVAKGATTAFVTNSVHYVRWLEEGSSKRAPRNFIKSAVARVTSNMRKMVEKAKRDNPVK